MGQRHVLLTKVPMLLVSYLTFPTMLSTAVLQTSTMHCCTLLTMNTKC